ncbi:MAG: general secretion pathway protein GspB [Cellvibrionaceae bacterium]|nr:general secretion pathway protein GspB [Cellvibrionaceae bacterium]
MSLILDALNKADNERKQKQEELPGIATAHDSFQAYQGKPKLKTTWLLVGAAFLVLLLIVVYFLGRSANGTTNTTKAELNSQPSTNLENRQASPTTATLRAEAKSPPIQAQTKTRPDNKLPGLANQNTAAASPDSIDSAQQTKQLIAQQYAKIERQKNRKANEDLQKENDIGELYQSAQRAPQQVTERPYQSSEPSSNIAAAKTAKDSIHYYTDIGSVREMSYSMQQKIPTLMYQNHSYHQGGRSTITINGKTVRKGGQVAQGVTIDDIFSDGIILKFQNQKFKMLAYSSWVNM